MFLGGLALLLLIGELAHSYLGLTTVTMYAFIGGFGLLPTMVSVLVLIAIESDALHQARYGELPEWVVTRYPVVPL
ncbi:hypothetical protein CCP3SC1_1820003 [Gammaproteobacteria bacterium]